MPPVEGKGQVSYAEMAPDLCVKDQPTKGEYVQSPNPESSSSRWFKWELMLQGRLSKKKKVGNELRQKN